MDHTAVLVIRAWREDDQAAVRVRLIGHLDGVENTPRAAVVVGADNAAAVVAAWLRQFAEQDRSSPS